MKPIQELFPRYRDLLPDGWQWCTIHYMFGEGRTSHFTAYGKSEDRTQVETDFRGRVRAYQFFKL